MGVASAALLTSYPAGVGSAFAESAPPTPGVPLTLLRPASLVAQAQSTSSDLNVSGPFVVSPDGAASQPASHVWVMPDLNGIPADARITSASIDMIAGRIAGGPAADCQVPRCNGVTITSVGKSWSPASTPAELLQATSNVVSATETFDVVATQDRESVDVTGLVDGWIRRPEVDHGLALGALGHGVQLAAAPSFTVSVVVTPDEATALGYSSLTTDVAADMSCPGQITSFYQADRDYLTCLASKHSLGYLVSSSLAAMTAGISLLQPGMSSANASSLIASLNVEQSRLALDEAATDSLLATLPAAPPLTAMRSLLQSMVKQNDLEIIDAFAFLSADASGRGSVYGPLWANAIGLEASAGALRSMVAGGLAGLSVPDVADYLCVPFEFADVTFEDADGNRLATPEVSADGQSISSGIDAALSNGGQSRIHGVMPPAGWTPVRAPDAQLATWDFPARPAGAQERRSWQATFSGFKSYVVPGNCTLNRQSAAPAVDTPTVPTFSPIYNGYSATTSTPTGHAFGVQGSWRQTAFLDGTCLKNPAYATWAGMGGPDPAGGGSRLIQSGTDVAPYTGARPFAWWEVLAPHKNSINETPFVNDNAVFPNDVVITGTQILHPLNSSPSDWDGPDGTALIFYLYDATRNIYMPAGINYGETVYTNRGTFDYAFEFATDATSYWVTERPTFGSVVADYRQPYLSNTQWAYEYSAYPGGAFGQKSGLTAIFMRGDGGSGLASVLGGGGPVTIGTDTVPRSDASGTGDFYSQWIYCH